MDNKKEFIRRAKEIRDQFAETVRVLDSTKYRNRTNLKEMYRERRKEIDALLDESEAKVDALRKELLG